MAVTRLALTPVIILVIALPSLLVTTSASPAAAHGSGSAHTAEDAFLLQLRAEVDRDRLNFVAHNSATQRQLSRLTSQVTQLSAKVTAIASQISRGGSGGGGGGGGLTNNGPQLGQGQSSGGGQGSAVPQGSCPSSCQVSSEVDRVRSAVFTNKVMVTQAVGSLQDHMADVSKDMQETAQKLEKADDVIRHTLSQHDTLLKALRQTVDHIDAVVKSAPFAASSSSRPFPPSFFTSTSKPTQSSAAFQGSSQVSLTSPDALIHLPEVVDKLKQQVDDLGQEQRQSRDAQNIRMTQMEQEVTQLHQDTSALQSSVKALEKEAVSTSQRLTMAETESTEASLTLTQGLEEVNVSLSAMQDSVHLLQATDAARAAALQQLTQQQASLTSRLAGNAHRMTSVVSDLSHLDHRLSVMSGVVQSGVEGMRDLNRTMHAFLNSSPGHQPPVTLAASSPGLVTASAQSSGTAAASAVVNTVSPQSAGTSQSPQSAGTSQSPLSQGATSTPAPPSSSRPSAAKASAPHTSPHQPTATTTAVSSASRHSANTNTAPSTAFPATSPTPKAIITSAVDTHLPITAGARSTAFPTPSRQTPASTQWTQLSSSSSSGGTVPSQTPHIPTSTFPVPTSMPKASPSSAVSSPTPHNPVNLLTHTPLIFVPTPRPGGAQTPAVLTPIPGLLIPSSPVSLPGHSPSVALPTKKSDTVTQYPSMAVPTMKDNTVTQRPSMAVPTRKDNSVTQRPSIAVPTLQPPIQPASSSPMAVPTRQPPQHNAATLNPVMVVPTKKTNPVTRQPAFPVPTLKPPGHWLDPQSSAMAVPTSTPGHNNNNVVNPATMAVPTHRPPGHRPSQPAFPVPTLGFPSPSTPPDSQSTLGVGSVIAVPTPKSAGQGLHSGAAGVLVPPSPPQSLAADHRPAVVVPTPRSRPPPGVGYAGAGTGIATGRRSAQGVAPQGDQVAVFSEASDSDGVAL